MSTLSALPNSKLLIRKKKSPFHLYTMMLLTFVAASAINVYPLLDNFALLRPMAMVMVLIFWLIFQPSLIGVGLAFLVGFSLDLLLDNKVGLQALCAVMVAFVIKFASGYLKQLSTASVWLLASVCLCLYQLALVGLSALLTGIFVPQLFISLGMSILAWPLLLAILRRYTR